MHVKQLKQSLVHNKVSINVSSCSCHVQSHTANHWESRDSNPSLFSSICTKLPPTDSPVTVYTFTDKVLQQKRHGDSWKVLETWSQKLGLKSLLSSLRYMACVVHTQAWCPEFLSGKDWLPSCWEGCQQGLFLALQGLLQLSGITSYGPS